MTTVQDLLQDAETPTVPPFPSGLTLVSATGEDGTGQEYWDPHGTGVPLYDTRPHVRSTRLSADFTVGELAGSGGRIGDRARISTELVVCLQAIRDRIGRPVIVTSGYRSWAANTELYRRRGTKPTVSRHCSGQAADITVRGSSGLQIAKVALDVHGDRIGIGVGDTFAHIDVRGSWAVWSYLPGAAGREATAELDAYRRRRPTPAHATPAPATPVSAGSDRAAGRVVRGDFQRCTGHAQPGAVAMAEQWTRLTGRTTSIYHCRPTATGSPSLHGEGRSIDLMGRVSAPSERAQADAYIAWMVANAVELQVAYIIWNQRQWSWRSRTRGWTPYVGGGRNPHTDHIHVDLSREGASTPSALFRGGVPGITAPSPTPTSRPLPDAFFTDLSAVAGRLRCDPSDLLAVMVSESDVRPWAQNPHGRATGLIQFMPATLTRLGWTAGPAAFATLSAQQQLPFVEKYYRPYIGMLTSPGRLYQATFLPATLKGSDESTVLASPTGPRPTVYAQNKGLDVNADGVITVSDLTARIGRVRRGRRWAELSPRLTPG